VQLQKLAPVLALHIAGRQPILFYVPLDCVFHVVVFAQPIAFSPVALPLRSARISVSGGLQLLDRKLPKLAKWKAAGAVSVLILETSDIALTNHILVAEAVQKLLHSRADRPDQIWLVDTVLAHVSFFGT
jgi:hypothetical protein